VVEPTERRTSATSCNLLSLRSRPVLALVCDRLRRADLARLCVVLARALAFPSCPALVEKRPMTEVFAVHAVRPSDVRPTELICWSLGMAERYAAELSTDPGVSRGRNHSVRSSTSWALGERSRCTSQVSGKQVPYVSDDRIVHANGAGHTLRTHRGG